MFVLIEIAFDLQTVSAGGESIENSADITSSESFEILLRPSPLEFENPRSGGRFAQFFKFQ